MQTKAKTASQTVIHIRLDASLKERIRNYRAKKQLERTPLSSDEKAILSLIDRGLEAETLNS